MIRIVVSSGHLMKMPLKHINSLGLFVGLELALEGIFIYYL